MLMLSPAVIVSASPSLIGSGFFLSPQPAHTAIIQQANAVAKDNKIFLIFFSLFYILRQNRPFGKSGRVFVIGYKAVGKH